MTAPIASMVEVIWPTFQKVNRLRRTFELTVVVLVEFIARIRQTALGVEVHPKAHSSIAPRALEENTLQPSHPPSEILTIQNRESFYKNDVTRSIEYVVQTACGSVATLLSQSRS